MAKHWKSFLPQEEAPNPKEPLDFQGLSVKPQDLALLGKGNAHLQHLLEEREHLEGKMAELGGKKEDDAKPPRYVPAEIDSLAHKKAELESWSKNKEYILQKRKARIQETLPRKSNKAKEPENLFDMGMAIPLHKKAKSRLARLGPLSMVRKPQKPHEGDLEIGLKPITALSFTHILPNTLSTQEVINKAAKTSLHVGSLTFPEKEELKKEGKRMMNRLKEKGEKELKRVLHEPGKLPDKWFKNEKQKKQADKGLKALRTAGKIMKAKEQLSMGLDQFFDFSNENDLDFGTLGDIAEKADKLLKKKIMGQNTTSKKKPKQRAGRTRQQKEEKEKEQLNKQEQETRTEKKEKKRDSSLNNNSRKKQKSNPMGMDMSKDEVRKKDKSPKEKPANQMELNKKKPPGREQNQSQEEKAGDQMGMKVNKREARKIKKANKKKADDQMGMNMNRREARKSRKANKKKTDDMMGMDINKGKTRRKARKSKKGLTV